MAAVLVSVYGQLFMGMLNKQKCPVVPLQMLKESIISQYLFYGERSYNPSITIYWDGRYCTGTQEDLTDGGGASTVSFIT